MTVEQFCTMLACKFPAPRIVDTWLQEFAYPSLIAAATCRGQRLERELDNHAKRLAASAQMDRGRTFITGRAGVIPR